MFRSHGDDGYRTLAPGVVEHGFVAAEDCEAVELFAPLREEYLG